MKQEKADLSQLANLVGGFAHELRNPLSTIGLNLKLLADEWKSPSDAREERASRRIGLLQGEVNRLQLILDEFLRIAHPPKLDKQPGDLNRILREMVPFVEPELRRRGIEIRLYCDQALPLVPMDSGKIRQVLLNLILNAQYALEEKTGEGVREILLSSKTLGDHVLISVMDNGPGMRAHVLERCWKPWFSSRKNGSGLGLPTAQRIITDHGGTIRVQSEVGKGTQFEVSIPLAQGEEIPR